MSDEIRLRDVEAGDLPGLFEHQRDPVAARMAAFAPRDEPAFMEHWRTRILGDPTVVKQAILLDGRLAGYVVCFERDGRREIGYWIDRRCWGRGVASEALRRFLNVVAERPLHAVVAAGNAASLRVLEKCGFAIEGRGRGSSDGRAPVVEEVTLRLDARAPTPTIRAERAADHAAVRAVNLAAFGGPLEADLVDALRGAADPLVSLVAEEGGRVVGHLMFSPVTLTGHPEVRVMGLAPMAVAPDRQRAGIGTALVRAGLERCRELGVDGVCVLGHPGYYPRFGFTPASRLALDSDYDVPDDTFMALELRRGALNGRAGRVHYHDAFGAP